MIHRDICGISNFISFSMARWNFSRYWKSSSRRAHDSNSVESSCFWTGWPEHAISALHFANIILIIVFFSHFAFLLVCVCVCQDKIPHDKYVYRRELTIYLYLSIAINCSKMLRTTTNKLFNLQRRIQQQQNTYEYILTTTTTTRKKTLYCAMEENIIKTKLHSIHSNFELISRRESTFSDCHRIKYMYKNI